MIKKVQLLLLAACIASAAKAQDLRVGLPVGITSDIRFVTCNQKSTRIISGTNDNTIKIWDIKTGRMLDQLKLSIYPEYAIFSQDEKRILIACNGTEPKEGFGKVDDFLTAPKDRKIIHGYFVTWNFLTDKKIDSVKIKDYRPVEYMELDPKEEKLLMLSDFGKSVTVFNMKTHAPLFSLVPNDIYSDPNYINKKFKLDSKTPDISQMIEMMKDPNKAGMDFSKTKKYNTAHFSPDGKKLLTTAEETPAEIWNAVTGAKMMDIKPSYSNSVIAQFDKQGKHILTACTNSNGLKLEIWNSETGKAEDELVNMKNVQPSNIERIEISSNWRMISSGTSVGPLVPSKKYIPPSFQSNDTKPIPFLGNLQKTIFSPDCKKIISYGRNNVGVFACNNLEKISDLKGDVFYTDKILISPDGKRMVTSFEYNRFEVRDIYSGKTLYQVPENRGIFFDPATNDLILKVSKGLEFRNKETGELKSFAEGNYSEINSDCTRAIKSERDGLFSLWDIKNSTKLAEINYSFSNSKPFLCAGDSRIIITNVSHLQINYQRIYVYDCKTGKELRRFDSTSENITFTPDKNKVLIIQSNSKKSYRLLLYDIQNDNVIECNADIKLTMAGGQYESRSRFSPNGNKFLVQDEKDNIYIYSTTNGKLLKQLSLKLDKRYSTVFAGREDRAIDFSDNGNFLKIKVTYNRSNTFSNDENVIVFNTETGAVLMICEGYKYLAVTSRFTPDNKLVIYNDKSLTPGIYDPITGKKAATLECLNSKALTLEFSTDKKYMYSSFDDGAIRTYSVDDGKLLSSQYLFDKGNAITLLPSGYYSGEKQSLNSLYYITKDLKTVSFDQLDIRYNRPDKVLEAQGSKDQQLIDAYRKTYYNRLERYEIDTTDFSSNIVIPEADFVDRDSLDYTETGNRLKLHIKAVDANFALNRFNLWINEVPLFGSRGKQIYRGRNIPFDTIVYVTLIPGRNKIETSVYNSNATESYRMPLIITDTSTEVQNSKTWFVGIGVNQYAIPDYNNLRFTVNDIRSVAEGLRSRIPGIDISIATNEEFSTEWLNIIKQKLERAAINDKVILMYSGHGILDKQGRYYFPSSKMTTEDYKQAIPYEKVEELLDKIPPRNKLMLIDACHSGILDKNAETLTFSDKTTSQVMDEIFSYVGRGTGATVIASSSGLDESYESPTLLHGFFTKSILDKMNENHGYPVRVSDLKDFIIKTVPGYSGSKQTPTIRSENKEMDFSVW